MKLLYRVKRVNHSVHSSVDTINCLCKLLLSNLLLSRAMECLSRFDILTSCCLKVQTLIAISIDSSNAMIAFDTLQASALISKAIYFPHFIRPLQLFFNQKIVVPNTRCVMQIT